MGDKLTFDSREEAAQWREMFRLAFNNSTDNGQPITSNATAAFKVADDYVLAHRERSANLK